MRLLCWRSLEGKKSRASRIEWANSKQETCRGDRPVASYTQREVSRSSVVKRLDKTALLQFSYPAWINELFRLGCFCLRLRASDEVEDRLHTFLGRIGRGRKIFQGEDSIGFFQCRRVFGLGVFFQNINSEVLMSFHVMNAFDPSLHEAAHRIGIFFEVRLAHGKMRLGELEIHPFRIHQLPESQLFGVAGERRWKETALDTAGFHGRQHFANATDLQ